MRKGKGVGGRAAMHFRMGPLLPLTAAKGEENKTNQPPPRREPAKKTDINFPYVLQ